MLRATYFQGYTICGFSKFCLEKTSWKKFQDYRQVAKIYSSSNRCSLWWKLLGDLWLLWILVSDPRHLLAASYKMERHFTLCFGNNCLVAVLQPISAVTRSYARATPWSAVCWLLVPLHHCQMFLWVLLSHH